LALAEDDHETVANLAEFLEALPEVDLQSELSRAIAVAAEDDDADMRAERLVSVASGLGRYPALLDNAVTAFRDSLDLAEQLESYVELLAFIPPDGRAEQVAEALNLARAAHDPTRKAANLVALTPLVDPSLHSAISTEALAACHEISDADARLERLVALLESDVDSASDDSIVDAARDAAWQITVPVDRAAAVGTIIPVAPDSRLNELVADAVASLGGADPLDRIAGLTRLAEKLADGPHQRRVLAEALELALALTNDLTRAGALMNLAVHMPVQDARPVVLEVARIPGGLLAVGNTQPDNIERVLLLAALAQSADAAHRVAVIDFGLSLIEAGDRPYDRARALAALAPVLSGPRRQAAVDEIHRLLGELANPAEQAELGLAMLKMSPDPSRDELLERTIGFARDIEPGYMSITVTVDNETLVTMSESMSPLMGRTTAALAALAEIDEQPLRRQSLRDEAFGTIYDLPAGMQVGAILEIAPALTLQQCQQVLRDFELILRDPRRQAVVDGVGSIDAESGGASKGEREVDRDVPAEGPGSGDTTADATSGREDGDSVSFRISAWLPWIDLYGLSRQPDQVAIDCEFGAEIRPDRIGSMETCLAAISTWTRDLAAAGQPEISDVPQLARDFWTGPNWPRAIGAVLTRVAELTSGREALDIAYSIWPDSLPPVVTASLVQYQPASERMTLIGESLLDAEQITDPTERAVSLVALNRVATAQQRIQAESALADAVAESLEERPPEGEWLATYLLHPPNSGSVPPAIRLRLIQHLINDTWDRRRQLQNLLAVLPAVLELGGPRTADTIAAAVRDVSTRWP